MTYQVCKRCVMDTSAPNISFDAGGNCNFCSDYLVRKASITHPGRERLDALLAAVKRQGQGKRYDCIIGVSGGVDSSYVLHQAVREYGLRPLAVHLDNGWNSELAVCNIYNLVESLGVDLYTHVIDWEENRDLQRSFFFANVVDIELLMDNAMLALNYALAQKWGLRHILSGSNTATEGVRMPQGWNHMKLDATNVRAIQHQFGTMPIKTHPLVGVAGYFWYEYVRKIHWVPILDYVDYKKEAALQVLERDVGYRRYPYKHYESVFTRFYQAYILPRKFNADKRRLHLSALICNGEMTRDEACALLQQSPYATPAQEERDMAFVLRKLGFTREYLDEYIAAPPVPHTAYRNEVWLWEFAKKVHGMLTR